MYSPFNLNSSFYRRADCIDGEDQVESAFSQKIFFSLWDTSLLVHPLRQLGVYETRLDATDANSTGCCKEADRGGEPIEEGFYGRIENHVGGANVSGEWIN